ncbi:MAG: putative copper-importing P-type ATPase A [Chlamydiia bacterium]|nr:putative copper-importing P-type ATPase A [Chlamydiia bacterium]
MTKKIHFSIEGMHCGSCVAEIEGKLNPIDGIESAKVNFASAKAEVTFDEAKASEEVIGKAIADLGYKAIFSEDHSSHTGVNKSLIGRMSIAIILSAPLLIPMLVDLFGFHYEVNGYIQLLLATIVQFGCGYPFYINCYRSLKNKSANMDVLVALGTTAAYAFSLYALIDHRPNDLYFETSAVLIALILLGRYFEDKSKRSAQSGMKSLLSMQPKTALIKQGSEFKEVDINDVKKGDILLIKPGSSVPVDGLVVSGSSQIDESMLTGESVPVLKEKDTKVFSGSVNGNGSIEIVADKLGSETSLGRIIAMVEEASASKAPAQKLADKVSSIFVPTVLGIAILTFIVWIIVSKNFERSILNAVATLVIACPCALGLATPTVIMVAVSKGASVGVLIKNAEAFELAKAIKSFVVDKTGTVTEGKLALDQVISGDKDLFMQIAGSLSLHSDHPVSQALLKVAKDSSVTLKEVTEYASVPGKGVSAKVDGKTYYFGSKRYLLEREISISDVEKDLEAQDQMLVLLADETKALGFCTYADPIKKHSKDSIEKLHDMDIKLYMLSGDRKSVVEKVANELMFDGYHAEVLPEDKAKYVKELKARGETVGMVGDGVNDAPALAEADVGFAVGSGTDVAMESASIGLMRSSIENLVQAVKLSKMTSSKIRQNLVFAFAYNCIGIPVAALGFLNPMIAGLAMALSSICVVLNAVLLKLKKL